MAKKKKGRRRQGLFSKAINMLLIGIGTIGVWRPLLERGFAGIDTIIENGTFGLVRTPGGVATLGSFDLNKGLAMYAPGGAAIGIGKLVQYLRRHFPVR